LVILLVKLRVKVGPKGQIIIPKVFRKTYRIVEGGYAIIELGEDGILIRGTPLPEDVLQWIRERRKRLKGKKAKLGELAEVDLEEEFED